MPSFVLPFLENSESKGGEQFKMEDSRVAPPNAYLKNCIPEIESATYGVDNRKPIHDVIEYLANGIAGMNDWLNDLGLVVQDGKLCVTYDTTGPTDEPFVVPDAVKTALAKILTDLYVREVRHDIYDSISWGVDNIGDVVAREKDLGLTVQNGKLCAVIDDASYSYSIPSDIQAAIERILTDIKGTDIRNDIVKSLRWGINNDFTDAVEEMNDIGLSVVDGKLCIEYESEE